MQGPFQLYTNAIDGLSGIRNLSQYPWKSNRAVTRLLSAFPYQMGKLCSVPVLCHFALEASECLSRFRVGKKCSSTDYSNICD